MVVRDRMGIAVVLAMLAGFLQGSAHASEVIRPAFQATPSLPVSASSDGELALDIRLVFNDTPTPAELIAFTQAEQRWESILLGYQVDDIADTALTIEVNLQAIDGAGGILASAGPLTGKFNAALSAFSPTFLYAQTGLMTFDTADTANLAISGTLNDTILHEMGHVLGIGTLWSGSAAVSGLTGRQEVYVSGSGLYAGSAGVAAYNAEFNQSGSTVPVELGGGVGTANAHWDEVNGGAFPTGRVSNLSGLDMQRELMTGWLNGPTFVSSLTKQSLVDIGFTLLQTGDVTRGGDIDAVDIDLLYGNLGSTNPLYDLNGNSTSGTEDVDFLVRNVLGTDYGDANLDGAVDIIDLGILGDNFDLTGVGWASGDFNGDSVVDIIDLGILGDNFGAGVNALGDTNLDGVVNASDIDLLFSEIGVFRPICDLNNDSVVDTSDVEFLVEGILETFYGDANLDGSVDIIDLGIVGDNYNTSGNGWAMGDFNGDTVVDIIDLGILGDNYGAGSGSSTAIPEPTGVAVAMLLVAGCYMAQGRRGSDNL